MDKYIVACIALSVAAHGVAVIHLPSLGASARTSRQDVAIEFSYLEAVAPRDIVEPAVELTEGLEATEIGEPIPEKEDVRETTPELLRGTGETLRASVRELLRPLEFPRREGGKELATAVTRYKKRLELILARNSDILYPREARQRRREARYTIQFSVKSDGSVERVKVPPSSGHFGREIIAGLKKASIDFPAFPPEITVKKLTFSWPVSFALN